MRRIVKASSIAGVLMIAAALLAGCSGTQTEDSSVVDLTDQTVIDGLCGEDAQRYLDAFQTTVDLPDGGKRTTELAAWGIEDPSDTASIDAAKTTLEVRKEVQCEPKSTPTATDTTCPAEFVQDPPPRGPQGQFAEGGILTIVQKYLDKNITDPTPEQKRDAQLIWTGHDALELADVADRLGWRTGGAVEGLVTSDGHCLSQEGQDLFIQYKGWVAAYATVADTTVDPNATNSAAQDAQVVVEGGVSGDDQQRSGWRVTAPNGSYLEWLDRCGNGIRPGGITPSVPEGPTDNHVYPKDPSKDPYVNGNANTGGGPNADPGPGDYQSPDQVTQPPSGPRVNPEPPAPIVVTPAPAPGQSAPVPTRDPAPPPPPEPSAPPSTAPETGCDASVPGVSC